MTIIPFPRPCVLYLCCRVGIPQFESRNLRFMQALVSVGLFKHTYAADEWRCAFLKRSGEFGIQVMEEKCFTRTPERSGGAYDYDPEFESVDYIACDLYVRVPQKVRQCAS